jgi:hypothetical protein
VPRLQQFVVRLQGWTSDGRAGVPTLYNAPPPVVVSPASSNITIFGLKMDIVKHILKPREVGKIEGNANEAAATMESLFECTTLAREVYKQSDDFYLDFLYAIVAGSYNDRSIMEDVPHPSELLQADYRNLLDYLFMWRYSVRLSGLDY